MLSEAATSVTFGGRGGYRGCRAQRLDISAYRKTEADGYLNQLPQNRQLAVNLSNLVRGVLLTVTQFAVTRSQATGERHLRLS